MCISIGHLSALCQEIVSPLSNWESDTLGNTQIRRPLWERMAFSRTNCPYPSDIPANGSANGSSPREKFLGTSENTRWKLRWVEEVGPQPESRAIANAKWLRDNFCLSSMSLSLKAHTFRPNNKTNPWTSWQSVQCTLHCQCHCNVQNWIIFDVMLYPNLFNERMNWYKTIHQCTSKLLWICNHPQGWQIFHTNWSSSI